MNYLMPFLIIICIGVIAVLAFNLWGALTETGVKKAAYMHIVEGNAKMKTWGTGDFFNIKSDALIMQGDEIVTSADAKIIVEFFDGTIMRLGGNTDVNFVEIDDKSDPPKVDLLLVDGVVWLNKLYRDTGSTEISVETGDWGVVSVNGGIFEVENVMGGAVRVLGGSDSSLEVNVYNDGGEKVVETETVGVGQEIVFTDAVLEKYRQFQSPSVIAAVGDEFKQTSFCLWNTAEDKAPTVFEKSVGGSEFVKVEPQAVEEGTGATADSGVAGTDAAGSGSGAAGADVAGSGSGAAGTDAAGGGSGAAGNAPEDGSATVVPAVNLSAPTVTSVGGVTTLDKDGYYVVVKNPATLTGGVSGNVSGVFVNGYGLKKFKTGDKTWTYYANADYGLMKEGANSYQVYAVDSAGNKSASITVKVMYKPVKPAGTATAETGVGTTETPSGTETTNQ